MKNCKKGFTLAELLIAVAIIGVLVAISIPIFTSQLEKSREATDLANVRSAYAEVMSAAISQDTGSPLYQDGGSYLMEVPLKQRKTGWNTKMDHMILGGIAYTDDVHWLNEPKAGGSCKVYYSDNAVFLDWGGDAKTPSSGVARQDHINKISAKDFLTKDILAGIVSKDYSYTVINSNELETQGGGTKQFMDYAREHDINLADYGAVTWQIYVKESGGSDILSNPAIYWSTLEIKDDMVGTFIPVMGYRDGKYDVYCAKVETYNEGTPNEYISIKNNFANVTEGEDGHGGTASFQFENYNDAKAAYEKILAIYEEKKDLTYTDMSKNGLN